MICCNYRAARLCGCYGCEIGQHCGDTTSASLAGRLLARLRRLAYLLFG